MKNFLQQINSYIKEALNAGKYLYNGLSVTFDHLLDLGWKFLLPISLANLLITAGLKLAFPQFFGG